VNRSICDRLTACRATPTKRVTCPVFFNAPFTTFHYWVRSVLSKKAASTRIARAACHEWHLGSKAQLCHHLDSVELPWQRPFLCFSCCIFASRSSTSPLEQNSIRFYATGRNRMKTSSCVCILIAFLVATALQSSARELQDGHSGMLGLAHRQHSSYAHLVHGFVQCLHHAQVHRARQSFLLWCINWCLTATPWFAIPPLHVKSPCHVQERR